MKSRPIQRRLCTMLFSVAAMAGVPSNAIAQEMDLETDARLEGYGQPVTIEGNTTITWILFIFIAVCGLSVMFKDAKRTHLD